MVADIRDVVGVVNASESDLPDSRVDESVFRILCYKIENGIIDENAGGDPPVSDGEAEYVDSDGLFGGTGSFEDVWEKATLFGGTVRLLQDCEVESVQSVSDRDITLDVNGHELYFTGTGTGFNVLNSPAHPFVIKDSSGAVSVSSSELTDFVRQNPKTTATDGMLSGVWDIDYVNRIAKWQSVDFDSCEVREVLLDLSQSGGIRMQNGVALLSTSGGSSVKFESGYITSDVTSTSSAVVAGYRRDMSLDVSGGWFFGYHSTDAVISMDDNSSLSFSGGGVVGSNTPKSAIYMCGSDSVVSMTDAHVSANIALEGAVRLYDLSAKMTIERCDISSNHGGGVAIVHGGLDSMNGCGLSFNRSMDDGGGLAVLEGAQYFNVGDSLFAYNSAKGDGGAMYVATGGFVKGHDSGAQPVRIVNNCADYGGGVCVDRRLVRGDVIAFDNVRFDGNEAEKAGGIGVLGHGYLSSFSDVLVENCVASSFPGLNLDIVPESSTDRNIVFNGLSVRDCRFYDDDTGMYTMNLRCKGTYAELSGFIDLGETVTMCPFSENTLYVLRNDFDVRSRIPVVAGFSVSLSVPVKLAVAASSGTNGLDISEAVQCFVPDAEHKVWYDSVQDAIMYGDVNYSSGSSSSGDGVQIEYFANIDVIDESASSGSYKLGVIDDSQYQAGSMVDNGGGFLPLNKFVTGVAWNASDDEALGIFGKAWPLKPVFLSRVGSENLFSVNSHVRLTELYRPAYVQVSDNLRLELSSDSVNRFANSSDGFSVASIWVHDNREELAGLGDVGAYVNPDNFRVYDYSEGLYLTSNADIAAVDSEHAIFVTDSSLVRFVADSCSDDKLFHTVFYDYNMTEPYKNWSTVFNSYMVGINSGVNYRGDSGRFGFGNSEFLSGSGYGLQTYTYNGVVGYFNQANMNVNGGVGRTFYGAAFGLVKGLDSNGDLVWNDSVSSPKLFNEPGASDTVGRKVYANSSLVFHQNGNVFTLGGVSGPDGEPRTDPGHDLALFFNPGKYNGVASSKRIFTNNFWPLDGVADYAGKDPLFGDDVVNLVSQSGYVDSSGNFNFYLNKDALTARSDDDVPHNAFFGMHFEVEFDLYDDYVGPMMYYFFGDDDMWVFLDGKLVLDIGGVHSSAGQYVDLRDYLPVKDAQDVTAGYTTHKLTVYYTERGASGSTCWMRFRLPTPLRVTTDVPEDVTVYGDLKVEKQVEGYDLQTDNADVAFPVEFTFKEGSGFFAPTLTDVFKYYDVDGNELGEVRSGDVLSLKAGEPVYVKQLPVGTVVSVAEDLSGFEHPEFWNLVESESTVKTEIVFGDENNLILKNRYNDKAELRITKTVVDGDNNPMDCADGFMFVGDFRVGGMPLSEPLVGYVCPVGSDPDTSGIGSTIQIYSGTSFTVPANSTVYIRNAPANLQYLIQELPAEAGRLGYALVGSPENAEGTVPVGEVREAVFVNALISDMPKLPSAGGFGTVRYVISGMSLLGIVAIELAIRKGKRTRSV